ncbi:MAG: vanadium-dependent haloperoxidase [Bacteroidota bacterium]|nr:vanadium-dependent haloperoxidase [Bacteroidota bacterium]
MKFHLRLWPMMAILAVMSACSDNEATYDVLPTTTGPSLQTNSITTKWTETYLEIELGLAGFRPAPTCRAMGYIHMGAYETIIPGSSKFRSLENVLPGYHALALIFPIDKVDWPIALNAYYARVHRFFLFGTNAAQAHKIDATETEQLDLLRTGVADGIVETSIEWGQDVADAIIAYAETDQEGATQSRVAAPANYFPPAGEGLWVPTSQDLRKAQFPFWGRVRTFASRNDDLISLPPVHKYSTDPGSGYYKDHLEVVNTVNNMTEENRWIAEFWSDDLTNLTFSPPARIFAIANQVVAKEKWNLEETLHMYCIMGLAINDAAVAAWKSKYIYNTERPETYIRKHIDPNFKTILGEAIGTPGINPAFPGYPSGHSTFAGVSQRIMDHFFGQQYEFTDLCHFGRTEFNGSPRTFNTWKQMAEEDAYSRIPLGVHVRMDCQEGLRLGNLMAVKALSLDLQK